MDAANSRRQFWLILLMVVMVCAPGWFGSICLAQRSVVESQVHPSEKAIFAKIGLATEAGQPFVKLLPVQDKREVAVCGLVNLQVPADVFLQSFRESMVRKSDPGILEIGRFNSTPTIEDLQSLTIEPRDIDDLKECVAGDCKVKLSAGMIHRFQNEIDWAAPDYRFQVTQLFKHILLDYVREYLRQGNSSLIEYNDKPNGVRLANEIHSLITASTFGLDLSGELLRAPKGLSEPGLSVVENAIVWSKIKFGLKPVIAINHIVIYEREQTTRPQILVVSKQIYANHYFDSSLAVTAFGNNPSSSSGSYLFYENRSRVDELAGLFGKIKREVIEDQAVASLKTILEKSKARLSARLSGQPESISALNAEPNWGRWTTGIIQECLWIFLISVIIRLLVLGNYDLKSIKPGIALPRLASTDSQTSHERHGE
jgi:hypothetical protein